MELQGSGGRDTQNHLGHIRLRCVHICKCASSKKMLFVKYVYVNVCVYKCVHI